MKRPFLFLGVLIALAFLAGALVLPQPAMAPTPPAALSPSPGAASAACPSPPARDLYDLAQRLRLHGAPAAPYLPNAIPPDFQVGHQQTFWLTNMDTYVHFTATATLRYRTPNAYFYVEDGVDVPQADLQHSAVEFESQIYPTIRRYFGGDWKPGVNNDPRLTVLNARIPGVGGYYSVADEYPTAVNPHSNQRKMIYVNVAALQPGTPAYDGVLAHELTHAVHWTRHRNEESWVSEGLAELGAKLVGHRSALDRGFLARPDTQLTAWPDGLQDSPPHYGAAFLFLDYFAGRFGGYDALREIVAQPDDGAIGLEDYLDGRGAGVTFDDVFRDWIVANYLSLPGGGPYSYPDDGVHVTGVEKLTQYGQRTGSVHPYAASYVEVSLDGDALLRFAGQPSGRLLPTDPHEGQYEWWSNRGDGIDSTLTREFDLTGVNQATLRFWLWYDIEKSWDYAYVEVSDDGGVTWHVLSGRYSSNENPVGNSFGPGYTGKSGGDQQAAWVEESVDLSPYAGKKILLRFEYVTDEGVNDGGLALDDLSIPEIGYRDGAEDGAGWAARGFVRTDNRLSEEFAVRLIKFGPTVSVEDLPLDAQQQGQVALKGLGKDLQRVVVVIASTTPCTTLPADYQLSVERLP